MPSKPLKPCNKYGCNQLTRNKYCEQHKSMEREADRNYNRYSRDKEATAFYKSSAWQAARRMALARDHGLCQHCLKQKRIRAADMVHHKVEVKEDWSKRLVIDNLVSLCNSCHNKVHGGQKANIPPPFDR